MSYEHKYESKYDEDRDVEEGEEDIDKEEWAEYDDEDIPYTEENVQILAPRILQGQEDRQHWHAETAYGMQSTTAEGSFGKTLRKRALASRSDEERFRDSALKIAKDAELTNSIRDSVLKLIPRIPDIRYKSAAGALFGFMAKDYIGKKLKPTERKELDKIFDKVQTVKDKNLRISTLDVIRYGRAWKIWLKEV